MQTRTTGRRPLAERLVALARWATWALRYPQLRGQRFVCGPHSQIYVARNATVRMAKGFSARRNFFAQFEGTVDIGADAFFNESCHVVVLSSLTIGNECSFGEKVSIHDEGHEFGAEHRDVPANQRTLQSSPISIGDNVWVGAKATILGGVSIGNDAVVAAHAVVTKDVPPYSLVAGVPARVIRSWAS